MNKNVQISISVQIGTEIETITAVIDEVDAKKLSLKGIEHEIKRIALHLFDRIYN